jgi:hypothetical protein
MNGFKDYIAAELNSKGSLSIIAHLLSPGFHAGISRPERCGIGLPQEERLEALLARQAGGPAAAPTI